VTSYVSLNSLRRLLTAASIIAGVPAIYLAGVLFVISRNACERWETPLARDDRGHSVVSTLQDCNFIASVSDEWIDLVLPSGRHERVFEFTPWEGVIDPRVKEPFEPSASWDRPGVLRISIGTVDGVSEQRTEVDGVQVVYDIGADLSH